LAFTTGEVPEPRILDRDIRNGGPQEPSGAPDTLDPSGVSLDLLGRHAGVGSRERVHEDQSAGPFRTGRRVQHRQWPRRDLRQEDDIVESGGGHHCVQVVGPTLQRWQFGQCRRIGQPRASLVVRDDGGERRQPLDQPGVYGAAICEVLVRDPRWDGHDVVSATGKHRECQAGIATDRVPDIGLGVHGHIVAPWDERLRPPTSSRRRARTA
jgi:hypothetical protein